MRYYQSAYNARCWVIVRYYQSAYNARCWIVMKYQNNEVLPVSIRAWGQVMARQLVVVVVLEVPQHLCCQRFNIVISHRRSLIFPSTVYIFAIWHHRLVSQSRTTGLLVRHYFYFRTEYSYEHVQLHCPKKQVPFSMAIGNGELMHECFPKHLRMGTARMK